MNHLEDKYSKNNRATDKLLLASYSYLKVMLKFKMNGEGMASAHWRELI